MSRKTFRPAAAVAVVALLALAGCGERDETTSAGAQVTPVPTTVAPATTTTVAQTTTTAPACANVSFSSNTDDKASDIKATGVTCTEAEALVRKVGLLVKGEGGPAQVESDGFACLRVNARAGDHGPASAIFECTNGAKKVTFTRT